ncbi:TPA: DUF2517 family protein [Photobacterium damselae]|uniref:Protein of uncharacterized function (DUF2517) n=1 Tax=Photobacterium damselae TaxID=38293 RepID=A0A2T3QQ15_PHODM|nr:DUF2517 family protein [Photobacterium damselae]PSB85182.1 DUF2517 domain-containing protein [Photobacterium damselae subsp. damselae]PSB85694.1 DUF2517 domain-containing protein [Photobacterium damselae subsp. damselae]PSW87201.1 DUF2517 domain-containing protein [Photobacterium damselae]TGZ36536.1 hypothetical protein EQ875_00315 [Photobacterium damselae subsp. damselae]UKA24565.1 YbfA family protein [Photobacterium damselae subsp. damselae]
MFTPFSIVNIILRRIFVLVAGIVSFPVMACLSHSRRSRFYSYLHRYWVKTSTKPVWLKLSEHGASEFY